MVFLYWAFSPFATYIDPIFILQKKTLKIITFNEVIASSAPLFDALQILKLNDIFKLQVTSFVYECLNNLAPIYFVSIHSVLNIRTGQSKKVTCFL